MALARFRAEHGEAALKAYRFALDLTAVQERAVLSHCGAARVAYNWGLARVKAVLDQRVAEPMLLTQCHDPED